MLNRFVAAAIVITGIVYAPAMRAQTNAPSIPPSTAPRESGKNIHRDGWDQHRARATRSKQALQRRCAI